VTNGSDRFSCNDQARCNEIRLVFESTVIAYTR